MRIISKEHDYYDRVMGQGQDESAQYLRKRAELTPTPTVLRHVLEKISNSFHYDPVQVRKNWHVFEPFVIAFCGKLYRGIKAVSIAKSTEEGSIPTRNVTVYYHWEDLERHLKSNTITVPRQPYYRGNMPFDKLAQQYLSAQGTNEVSDFLLEQKIVILTCNEKHLRYFVNGDRVGQSYTRPEYVLTIDDTLAPLSFGQLFDAFSAYQEIDMYVSGTLANNTPPPVELTEKDRINQHGFDKWSFRRLPDKT